MSRHHHIAADTAHQVQHDVQHLSHEELNRLYGIEVLDDGSVYDPTYSQHFKTLGDWVAFEAEQDEMDYSEEYGHGKQTYDDYY